MVKIVLPVSMNDVPTVPSCSSDHFGQIARQMSVFQMQSMCVKWSTCQTIGHTHNLVEKNDNE